MISLIKRLIPDKIRIKVFKELSQGSSVLLRAPKIYPKAILDDFSEVLKNQHHVDKAYLAEGYLSDNEDVHYIIGLFVQGISTAELMQNISRNPKAQFPDNFPVDYTILKVNTDPIYQFMEKYLVPFYVKVN